MADIKDLLSAAARKSVSDFADTFAELMQDRQAEAIISRRDEILGNIMASEDFDPDEVEEIEDDEDEDDLLDWDDIEDEDIEEALSALEGAGHLDAYLEEAGIDLELIENEAQLFAAVRQYKAELSELSKPVVKAVSRLTKEEVEGLDELSTNTLKSYADKSSRQIRGGVQGKKLAKRREGYFSALDRLHPAKD